MARGMRWADGLWIFSSISITLSANFSASSNTLRRAAFCVEHALYPAAFSTLGTIDSGHLPSDMAILRVVRGLDWWIRSFGLGDTFVSKQARLQILMASRLIIDAGRLWTCLLEISGRRELAAWDDLRDDGRSYVLY